ncbi:Inactive ubiquitin carboxyl-terminal hydrolase MINDY-4B [Frankliniella fusca]|uniref:Ubiquitin carboxyl-terminal hydrolase MINDY n=1 Tax=Frankliniella fusca TaxID=407009 RepID=A0AAE1HKV4_9NEOP|nr:Inactive ubiquitin carboxyl-terminal hydrolase MINDY-4B [Frankliniella fusca]
MEVPSPFSPFLPPPTAITTTDPGKRVMYGRSQRGMHMRTPVMGGTPITEQQAVQLRTVVFGDAATPPRSEWSRTGLVMREPERDLGYGLRAPRNGTRGLLAVVQAYLVKHLLFEAPPGMEGAGPPTGRPEELLRPSRARQYEALWAVVSAILWKVGEQQRVQVALPQEKNLVPHSPSYFQDGVTEKLPRPPLRSMHYPDPPTLPQFTDDPGPGTLLLLYSAVLTRGCDKVQADLEDEKACLVTTAEEGPQTIVTLLLVGRATPYLHNGIVYVGDEDHYALPQYGVLNRSDVGYLVWDDTNESELQESSRQPGSRLKTPSLPVWVVSCSGHYGVIFNTNRELLRNYHAERRFELLYYTAGAGQWSLTVDTRFNEAGESTSNKSSSASSSRPKDDFTTTAQALCLEKVIHTKWQDAHVTWNSMIPGV